MLSGQHGMADRRAGIPNSHGAPGRDRRSCRLCQHGATPAGRRHSAGWWIRPGLAVASC